jgi:acetoin utilization deacetylase AcuC-like enzyme
MQLNRIPGSRYSRAEVIACKSLPNPDNQNSSQQIYYVTYGSPAHDYPGHAESALRVPAIIKALDKQGLSTRPNILELEEYNLALPEDIVAVHDSRYVQALERVCEFASPAGQMVESDTYCTPTSYGDALTSSGAVISLVDQIMTSSASSSSSSSSSAVAHGFAMVRPPGHHAIPKSAMGFCLFSTVAVAVRHSQRKHNIKKVAIFDWDVHMGNGTSDIFYEDPDVLFISTHQHNAYPYTGDLDEVGRGDGLGTNINIPIPYDSGHQALLSAYDEIVEPAIRRHKPEMIFISAGYDAHWKDPLAGLSARTETFHALGERVGKLAREICRGRLVCVLEGGYDLDALGDSVANTMFGMLGEGHTDMFDASSLREEPIDKVREVIREARRIHEL